MRPVPARPHLVEIDRERVRNYVVAEAVDDTHIAHIEAEDRERIMRRTAVRMLADKLIRDWGVHRTYPDPVRPMTTIYEWSVWTLLPGPEQEAFSRAQEDARRAGLEEALDIVRRKAARYRGAEGPYGHIIASGIDDIVHLLREKLK
jgi:hypothetical protein